MMTIALRDRYYYANLTNPTYPVTTIGGIPHWVVGIVDVDGASDAVASGYILGSLAPIDETANIALVASNVGGIPKLSVCIPTSTPNGFDGFAKIELQYQTSIGAPVQTLDCSVRTYPLANFLVSCAEQPDGVDVWALDIADDCESERTNGNAIDASITDILFTAQGERPRRTNYGSPIPRILWSNIDSALAENLLDRVIEAINRFERRVAVDRQRASMTIDKPRHMVFLTLPYSVIENQKQYLYRKKFAIQ